MSSKRDRARSCMHSFPVTRVNMALVTVFNSSSNVNNRLAVCAFFLSLSYCGCSSHGTAERGLCFRAFTMSVAHVSRRSGGWQSAFPGAPPEERAARAGVLRAENKLFFGIGSLV